LHDFAVGATNLSLVALKSRKFPLK